MYLNLLLPLAFGLGWTISPDALIMIGNNAGRAGFLFIPAMLVAAMYVFWLRNLAASASTPPAKSHLLYAHNLCTALALVLFLPTGALVTAGFTFNETFVYWFPNFAFAALLLLLVVLVQLAGERWAGYLQLIALALALVPLLFLILAGLFIPVQNSTTAAIVAQPELTKALYPLLGGMLIFLASVPDGGQKKTRQQLFLLLTSLALVVGWGFVSARHLPAEKLATSTIPYIQAAREILGQEGRVLIGITIVAASLGLVNSLFSNALLRLRVYLNSSGSTSNPLKQPRRLAILLFAMAIYTALFTGLAGGEKLESYIFGSLLLWLLGTMAMAFFSPAIQQSGIKKIFIALPAAVAIGFLVLSHVDILLLTLFLFLACAFSLGLTWLSLKKVRRLPQNN